MLFHKHINTNFPRGAYYIQASCCFCRQNYAKCFATQAKWGPALGCLKVSHGTQTLAPQSRRRKNGWQYVTTPKAVHLRPIQKFADLGYQAHTFAWKYRCWQPSWKKRKEKAKIRKTLQSMRPRKQAEKNVEKTTDKYREILNGFLVWVPHRLFLFSHT